MGICTGKEGTERAAREAEKKKEEERLRKQREQELRRDASKAADALAARGVERAAGRIDGWLIYEKVIQVPEDSLERDSGSPNGWKIDGTSVRMARSTGTMSRLESSRCLGIRRMCPTPG